VAAPGKHVRRIQEIRYSHAGVQHSNLISGGDALALRDFQHLSNGAFYKGPGSEGPGSALPVVGTVQYYSLLPFTKVTIYKGLHFRKTNAGRVQKCLLRAFSKLHNCIFEFRPIRLCESRVHEDRK
jgi:hypothetical protein